MSDTPSQAPGIGIDYRGMQAIDPTKNVEALVKALEDKLKELRETDNSHINARFATVEKFMDFAREAEARLQNSSREAETRRIDQLAINRQEFQNTIRDMLAESVRTTSTLVSTQLVQIQATFDTRVSKLEAFQWQSAGRSSVADPAIENAINRMNVALSAMQEAGARGGGRDAGREATNAKMMAGFMAVIALIMMLFGGYNVLKSAQPVQPVVSYVPAPTAPPSSAPAPITVPR